MVATLNKVCVPQALTSSLSWYGIYVTYTDVAARVEPTIYVYFAPVLVYIT